MTFRDVGKRGRGRKNPAARSIGSQQSPTVSGQALFPDKPLVDAIIGSAPYDAAITIDLLPQPALEDVVAAIDDFVQELCIANSLWEDGYMTPLSINGFWLVQDLVQITSDDRVGKPLFKCVFLFCLNPAIQYDRAELVNSMIVPDHSHDSEGPHFFNLGTMVEMEIIRDAAVVADRFSSCVPFHAAPAVAIGAFDQNGILAHWAGP